MRGNIAGNTSLITCKINYKNDVYIHLQYKVKQAENISQHEDG